jgi:hypothetical protein
MTSPTWTVVVLEGTPGRAVEIVELSAVERPQEGEEPGEA